MLSNILDDSRLGALLEMGGESLRAQLLEDLQRYEAQIAALSTGAPVGQPPFPLDLRHMLHEMRGIAVTIGAAVLTQSCAAAEAEASKGQSERLLPFLAQVLNDSSAVRSRIQSCSGPKP